jgi:hypothetical protein
VRKIVEVSASLGFRSAIDVDAVPITEITSVTAPQGTQVHALQTRVTVRGACRNIPKNTAAKYYWIIKRENEEEHSASENASLQVNGNTFELHAQIDCITHRLFGKGQIGIGIAPEFPYCEAFESAPNLLLFDNPLMIEHSPVGAQLIGAVLTIKPTIAPIFRGELVKLDIYEVDQEEESHGSRNVFTWQNNMDGRQWRIGCSQVSPVKINYPEKSEDGDYEYAYRLTIAHANAPDNPMDVKIEPALLTAIKRPELKKFELKRQGHDLYVTGEISNCAPDLGLKLLFDIRLLHEKTITFIVGDREATVRADGTFEANMGSYGEIQRSTAAKVPKDFSGCFSAMHISEDVWPESHSLPFIDAINFDHAIFLASEGLDVTNDVNAAHYVFSKEAKVLMEAAGIYKNAPSDLKSLSPKEFVDAVYKEAHVDETNSKVPAAITTAQAVLESGYGKSVPTDIETEVYSYNLFGIKGAGTAGSVTIWTQEFNTTTNKMEKIKDKFAAYNSYQESIRERSNFFKKNARYKTLFNTADAVEWAKGLQKAGYATDPNYAEKLIQIMKQWKLI